MFVYSVWDGVLVFGLGISVLFWCVCIGGWVVGGVVVLHFITVQNQSGKLSLPITCSSHIYPFPYLPHISVSFATCKNFPSCGTAERRLKLLRSVKIASSKAVLLMLWSLTSWQLFTSENLWSSGAPSVSLLPALLHCSLL